MLAQRSSAGWVRRDRTELSDENAEFDSGHAKIPVGGHDISLPADS